MRKYFQTRLASCSLLFVPFYLFVAGNLPITKLTKQQGVVVVQKGVAIGDSVEVCGR